MDLDIRALKVHYLGLNAIKVENSNEELVLLYFTIQVDSTEVPVALSREQAEQLNNDLDKILKSENTC